MKKTPAKLSKSFSVNRNSYDCSQERFLRCTEALQAFDKVSVNDKISSYLFHELPENLSRGKFIAEKLIKTCHCHNSREVFFKAEDTRVLGLIFCFKLRLNTKENRELSLRFHSIGANVWELRFNEVLTPRDISSVSEGTLGAHSDEAKFLIQSAVDILKMICFYSSFHKYHCALAMSQKRCIVFQFRENEKMDKHIRNFLLDCNCGWIKVDKTLKDKMKTENIKVGCVHVGSALYSIPSQFYQLES